MLNIAICDDEEYFRKRIKTLIATYMEKMRYDHCIHCFRSGKEFLLSISGRIDYNIVFLDINMEEMNGIETALAIRALTDTIYIVFVTAFIDYAIEGYKVNAVRYILKEDCCLKESVEECLHAILRKIEENQKKIVLEFGKRAVEIAVDKILYAESKLHKVIFFVIDDGIVKYSTYNKLDQIETTLKPYGFCRIHQSYLINMNYMTHITRYSASLLNGTELSISKKYYKKVEKEYIKIRGAF